MAVANCVPAYLVCLLAEADVDLGLLKRRATELATCLTHPLANVEDCEREN